MQVGDKIEGEVRVVRTLFSASDSDYKIIGVVPVSLDTYIPLNSYGNITIKGLAPSVLPDTIYKVILLVKEEDPKYGAQLEIIYMGQDIDFSNEEAQKLFLEQILTEKQIETLYDTLDNPMECIKERDFKSLTSCKGIGIATAERMYEKYIENKDYSYAFVELRDYGLSAVMVKKIVESYGSPQRAVEKINENPYILAQDIEGIGFIKADEIAINGGVSKYSPERVEAFIVYFLDNIATNGYSWVHTQFLFDSIYENLKVEKAEIKDSISIAMVNLIEKKLLWHNEDKTKIALKKVRDIESELSEHLLRILYSKPNYGYRSDWEDVIDNMEKAQGWEFTGQQRKGIATVLNNNVVFITGLGGCVDKDTEYFNGEEWKKISEYQNGDMVLQFNDDRSANLVYPKRYIKEKEKEFYEIKTVSNHINQRLSKEHNIVYETSKGHLGLKKMSDFLEMHHNTKHGFNGRFLTTFNYSGEGIDLTDIEIRLMVSVMADGSFRNNTNMCRININKERKIKRLINLLNEAEITYTIRHKIDGMTEFTFRAPLRLKQYPKEWYNCSKEQLEIIAEECLLWDGSIGAGGRMSYFSSIKSDADFIQFVFSSVGKRATIATQDRRGEERNGYIRKSIDYIVQITQRSPNVSIVAKTPEEKINIPKIPSEDGYKYCFEVPSGMLVLRRDDRIFITGNSGKTTLVNGMLEVLNGKQSIQMALAGKAGARLAEVTGKEGYTIHRGLGYSPMTGWGHDYDNPLDDDIVIVDELSMVSADLMLRVVRAVKSGSKLVVLADTGQLESIGMGNIAQDMMESNVIPVVNLTEVHRQAKSSSIAMDSRKVRVHEDISSYPERRVANDLEFISLNKEDSKNIQEELVLKFQEEYKKAGENPLNIQVVVPMRERGDLATFTLNEKIREICNPQFNDMELSQGFGKVKKKEHIVKLTKDKQYTLRVGDKVINTKNDLKIENEEGNYSPIYNGDTGILIDIIEAQRLLVIDIVRTGIVYVPFSKSKNIELAYALTAHKCIPRDTMIDTNLGKREIDFLDNGARPQESKLIDNNIQVYNGHYLEKPKSFYNNGLGVVRTITTQSGFDLTMSTGHRAIIINKEGERESIMAHNLKAGDKILMARGVEPSISTYENLQQYFDIELKNPIFTLELSQWLGILLSIGNYDSDKGILQIKADNATKGYIRREYRKLFYDDLDISKEVIEINQEVVKGLIKMSRGNYEEKIPYCVYSAGSTSIKEFLKGAFYNSKLDYNLITGKIKKITLNTKNDKMAQNLGQMLLVRNIIPQISSNQIIIEGEGIREFVNRIGFSQDTNKEIAYSLVDNNYIDRYTYTSHKINHDEYKTIIKNVIQGYNISIPDFFNREEDRGAGVIARIACNDTKGINLQEVKSVYDVISRYPLEPSLNLELLRMISENYHIETIIDINESIQETVCLEMSEIDTFTQNSMLMHNCQGSETDRVIVGLDFSAYTMLSKEWVYTAMTRAKKYCVIISEVEALKFAIKTSRVREKQTFLKELLREKEALAIQKSQEIEEYEKETLKEIADFSV